MTCHARAAADGFRGPVSQSVQCVYTLIDTTRSGGESKEERKKKTRLKAERATTSTHREREREGEKRK